MNPRKSDSSENSVFVPPDPTDIILQFSSAVSEQGTMKEVLGAMTYFNSVLENLKTGNMQRMIDHRNKSAPLKARLGKLESKIEKTKKAKIIFGRAETLAKLEDNKKQAQDELAALLAVEEDAQAKNKKDQAQLQDYLIRLENKGKEIYRANLTEQKDISNYHLFYGIDEAGKTHHFIGDKNRFVQGGEAVVRFGYRIDDQGQVLSEEGAIRMIKQNPAVEQAEYKALVEKEANINRVLYQGTSPVFTFPDGTIGYSMEKLPGKDFVKKWTHTYNSVLIHENKGDPDITTMKLDQLVLSADKVYWLQDGRLESIQLSEIENKQKKAIMIAGFKEYTKNKNTVVTDPEFINTVVTGAVSKQEVKFPRPGKGFDCREFSQAQLSFLQRCQVMREVFKQLREFHQANYIHGDINPTNIKVYVDHEGNANAKLFDFGQSQCLDGKPYKNLENGLGGMPEFRAPEVVRYERYGQSSDMYSMAGLMGMMFTENPNRFIDLKLTFGDYFEIDQDRDDYKKILAAATTPYNFESMFEGIGSGIDEGLKSNMCAFVERMGDPNEANRPSSEEAAQYFTSLCEVYELKNTAQAPDLLKKFLSDFSQAAPAKIAEEKPVSPSPR